jgi:hypothetical protein
MQNISRIEKKQGYWSWTVNEKPFIAYAGEVHNSSASNLEYMQTDVWPYVKNLNLNTLIVPIYWEKVEPVEGEYDFSLLEGLILQARKYDMKLILLWFGLWKNGLSSYVPHWVKKDTERFIRAKDANGKQMDVVSPLCQAGVDADREAFKAVVQRLKEMDEKEQTVIAVQVENEMGLLQTDRDYSNLAEAHYEMEIPETLKELYGLTGNYEQAFGKDAPEYLMAYSYASATERIAKAGKEIYPIPYFVNAWIEKYPWRPGMYPSGGPVAKFIPLWQRVAPSIDALAPDIYISDFYSLCNEYTKHDNPLIIPEHRRDINNVSNVFYAVGKHNALCFAPFGIEDFPKDPNSLTGIGNPTIMKTLAIDVEAWDSTNAEKYLAKAYEVLQGSQDMLLEYRAKNQVYSFIRINEHEKGTVIETPEYDIKIVYQKNTRNTPKSAGIILQISEHEFYLMGTSFSYSFLPKKNERSEIGILDYEEGSFVHGKWKNRRTLNGDERYFMSIWDMPEIQRVVLYKY